MQAVPFWSPHALGKIYQRYREKNTLMELDTGESIAYQKFRYVAHPKNQFKWIIDSDRTQYGAEPITGIEVDIKGLSIRTNSTLAISEHDLVWLPIPMVAGTYYTIQGQSQSYGYFPKMRKTFQTIQLQQLAIELIETWFDEVGKLDEIGNEIQQQNDNEHIVQK